jgi:hypothetical protein
MGNPTALALADTVEDRETLEIALYAHLRSNHYPPVNPVFVPTCVEAINLATDGHWDARLEMPNGVVKTVAGIVEGLHLSAFIHADDDEW